MKINFETKTCGRCNGKGRISAYSGVYGGVCFGCNGAGAKLTRNGKQANDIFNEVMTVVASTLEIGMIVWEACLDGKNRRRRIDNITTSNDNSITLEYHNGTAHMVTADTKIRRTLNADNRDLAVEALANLKGVTITEEA